MQLIVEAINALPELEAAIGALRAIRDFPSEDDLLYNAAAHALHYIAYKALEEIE